MMHLATQNPPRRSTRLYVRTPTASLAMLRFLLEGEDHLGYLSMVDSHTGLAAFIHSPDQRSEALAFLERAQTVVPLELVAAAEEFAPSSAVRPDAPDASRPRDTE